MRKLRSTQEVEETQTPKGFNLQVTYRDEKTGLVTHKDPYILRTVGEAGSSEKMRLWERPAGSGNLWDKHNNPVGRWVYEEKVIKGKTAKVGKYDEKAEHIAWAKPLTQDELIARENATLKAEIAALKAEQTKKSAPTKKDQGA